MGILEIHNIHPWMNHLVLNTNTILKLMLLGAIFYLYEIMISSCFANLNTENLKGFRIRPDADPQNWRNKNILICMLHRIINTAENNVEHNFFLCCVNYPV